MNLLQTYQGHGVTFQFPEPWELTEETQDDATTISVGDGASFWSVTVLRHRPAVEDVFDQACAAFREEYDELDEYPVAASVGGETVPARNLEFVAFELINLVQLRAVIKGGVTLFVMAQVTDHEREEFEPIFQQISNSLQRLPDNQIMIE